MMTRRLVDAVLLDMDGTILNSIKSAERIWGIWAADHGLDVEAFLPTIHGVQSVETIRRLGLPGVDPLIEAARITQAETEDVEGIDAITGAAEFLAALADYPWAIVTSAPRDLAVNRIRAVGLPMPPLLIAAEDVDHGKPAPDCFHLAAERLATTADRCLVLEDSVSGVQAAEAAGALVVVVTETHHTPMDFQHPAIVDYRDLAIERCTDGRLSITRAAGAPRSQSISCVLRAPVLD